MKTCPHCDNEFEDTFGVCPRHDSDGKTVDEQDPLLGVTIRDRYQLTQVIGRGAMGVVYKASQLNDGKEVAIKVLHAHLASNTESLKRFQYEAQAASSLMHPHIVRLYDVGVGPGGQPYIAMEFLSGTTLSEYMRGRRHLNATEALPIIRQVCEALAEAHRHGVLHRDIKPANIMLMNRFGQENFVVVLDFSIAKVIQTASDVDSTTPGLIFGSPAYMSPERFMGRGGDFRSDIYSMGIIIFQMLAGRAPFKSSDLYTLMSEHVGTQPPRVTDVRPDAEVPEELEQLISRALAKNPKDRQENMKQLLADLDEVYRVTVAAKAKANSENREVQTAESLYATNDNGHLSSPPVATLQKTAGDGAFGAPVAKQDQNTNIFDIDPGLTPVISLPTHPGGRKPPDDQNQNPNSGHQKLPPELMASGTWNKSLVARAQQQQAAERQRPNIRPAEKTTFPLELLALTAVVLLGVGAIGFTQMQPPTNPTAIAVQRRIAANDLEGARAMLTTWHISMKPGEEDRFGEVALGLGKLYFDRKDYGEAESCLLSVPNKSKSGAEAQRYLQKLGKLPNPTAPSR